MSKIGLERLKKELKAIQKEPVPGIHAFPLPNDLLEWHYAIQGPKDSPFAGGVYHGKIKFPSEYPNKPPAIFMFTPNGRFAVNKRICMSMSDFHPESWNPMWSVSSILSGLLSFMLENEPSTGCVDASVSEKRALALRSMDHNLNGPQSKIFRELFPHIKQVDNIKPASQDILVPSPSAKKSGLDTSVLWLGAAMLVLAYILFSV
eukprot:c10851_g1_i1.p1 GENE.c10851_g1_i1~~c10851_g1_i1.p1  ORF type:complete len:205 (+),score=17.27 c10851_g1_i1:46-660(+)